ncbi:MAG TPA: mandelate racemase/muconate lactonizing enzyme family protein [Dehalococcoidia bacterium]|nr:mandelate racemase/muconate lactonizing enzyme family protein [Dehalococcoidia bacterium]
MKITRVEAMVLTCPLEKPIMDATYTLPHRSAVLVRVDTDEGLSGLGEAAYFGGPPMITKIIIEKELQEYLIGEDPLNIERLWEKMYQRSIKHGRKGAIIASMSGIDIALWDIKAKAAGMPLYQLLGGCHERIRAYASAGFYAEGKGIKELAEEMASYVKEGFTAVKMKIGRLGQSEDVARVRAVREAIGDNVDLLVDGNNAYTAYQAIKIARRMEEYNIFWFEEPVPAEDIEGSAAVAAAIDTPVAAGENEFTRYGFRDLFLSRAVDIAQPDVTWCGGITEAKKIAAMASAWNIICVPHSFSSAIALVANLHFSASIPNSLFQEFDRNYNPLREDLLTEPVKINKDGYIDLWDKPGLGVELDQAVVKRYRAD